MAAGYRTDIIYNLLCILTTVFFLVQPDVQLGDVGLGFTLGLNSAYHG